MEVQTPIAHGDAMIIAGSDSGAASCGAELFSLGFAPIVVVSGNAQPGVSQTEADMLANTLRDCGVPDAAIVREQLAHNPGETIRLSQQLLAQHNINPKSVSLVHRPHCARSFLATAEAQWPD